MKKYLSPEVEMLELEVADVILASAGGKPVEPPKAETDDDEF